MTTLKTIAIASIVATLIGGAAIASDATDVGNPGMLLYGNGTLAHLKADSKMHSMIMRYAKPYSGPMIFASGGRLYTIENARMSDGRMLYDVLSPSNPDFMADVNR